MTINSAAAPLLCPIALILAVAAVPSTAMAAACGTAPNEAICMGKLDVPPAQLPALEAAAKAAVDALSSPDLERDYKAFTATHLVDGPQGEAWKKVEIEEALGKVRAAIGGLSVTTYGGVGGWFKKTFSNETISDGVPNQPIRINRWALPMPVPALAKVITHEAAHKAGLTHPSTNPTIAACEPVYVIASLVEKTIVGEGWKRGSDDCPTVGR